MPPEATAAPAPAAPATPAPSAPSKPSAAPDTQRVSIRDFKARGGTPVAPEPEVETPPEAPEPEEIAEPTMSDSDPVEEPPELEEDDLSWAQELRDFKELHGLPLAEVVKALAEGRLPDSFLDKLKLKLKSGDYEWEDTIEGARKGAMLRRDYTQKRMADAREREIWTGEKNEIVGLLHGWQNDTSGAALLAGAKRMGFPILEAAKLLAQEHRMLNELPPEARELYEQKQKAEQELERFKYEQAKVQRQQADAQTKASVDRHVEFVTQVAQAHFNHHGIPLNKGSWGVFLRNFDAIRSANPSEPWNEQMVQIAVEATKEEYDELKRQVGAAHAPVVKPQVATAPTTPGRQQLAQAGLGGAKYDSGKTPRPKNNGRVTIADMKKRFGMR